jgi:hypothetical protein
VTAAGGAGDTAQVSVRFVPWGAVAGAAGVFAAAGALFAVRRRRRRRLCDDEAIEVEQPLQRPELTGAGT